MEQTGPFSYFALRTLKYSALKGTYTHNERTAEDGVYSHRNVDAGRSHLNPHFIQPKGEYTDGFQKIMGNSPDLKVQKGRICGIEALFGMPDELRTTMSDRGVLGFFHHCMDFLTEECGVKEEHILSAVIHMDENDYHMHLVFVPVDENGKLSGSKFICRIPDISYRAQMSAWQTRFHDYINAFYPFIQRGILKEESGRTHLPMHYAQRMRDERLRNNAFLKDLDKKSREEIEEEFLDLSKRYGNLDRMLLSMQPYITSLERRLKKETLKNEELKKIKKEYLRLAKKMYTVENEKKALEGGMLKMKMYTAGKGNKEHAFESRGENSRESI